MNIQIDDKEFELMLEYDQILKRIRLIGIQLNVDYEGRVPVFLGVLNGGFMFMADLLKEIELASEVTFVRISSYEGASSTGNINQLLGLQMSLKDRDVIIVEDIVETGASLHYLLNLIKAQEPASVKVCSLLFKPQTLKYKFDELEYIGFEILNQFVVGYGLDYNGLGRNLRDIYRVVVKEK
ncbi:hypoxanthine phosphoribosyltransferase (plasmid) [Pedobacter sp. BS3]|uniref:hypoxanthine phosphoribosyltransferase n=1 Tax=Pedobacter sp. BS3 TaxID=2567937 RepID=UPI0011EF3E8C|nr:hypoxanthine phosphoribosyltransferase [Pedobacter sp. BS3]TZF85904.1 hypoxanthine phosphoribosyltransferase [Pedobacter sp. BS3]